MLADARSLKSCLAGLAAGAAIALISQLGLLPLGSLSQQSGQPVADAGQTSGEGGLLSRLAGAVSGPAAAPAIDFGEFKHGEILKALQDRNFQALNQDEAQTLAYLSGFQEEISGQGVIFYTDSRDILSVVDPSLTVAINNRLATSSQVVERSTQAGMDAFMGMLQGMAETRRSGGSVSEEITAMNRGALSGNTRMPVVQWQSEGQKDARILAGKFETNRDEFEQIYSGLAEYLGR